MTEKYYGKIWFNCCNIMIIKNSVLEKVDGLFLTKVGKNEIHLPVFVSGFNYR